MDPLEIIKKYYDPKSEAFKAVVTHGKMVARKALQAAKRIPELKPDLKLVEEAAMLHDIGIINVNAPMLGCDGGKPYEQHITEGRKIMLKEGYPKHARICAIHTGVGLTKEDIIRGNLDLPQEDLVPETIEEELVTFADLFYSKVPGKFIYERSKEEVIESLKKFGDDKVEKFLYWCQKFKED